MIENFPGMRTRTSGNDSLRNRAKRGKNALNGIVFFGKESGRWLKIL